MLFLKRQDQPRSIRLRSAFTQRSSPGVVRRGGLRRWRITQLTRPDRWHRGAARTHRLPLSLPEAANGKILLKRLHAPRSSATVMTLFSADRDQASGAPRDAGAAYKRLEACAQRCDPAAARARTPGRRPCRPRVAAASAAPRRRSVRIGPRTCTLRRSGARAVLAARALPAPERPRRLAARFSRLQQAQARVAQEARAGEVSAATARHQG